MKTIFIYKQNKFISLAKLLMRRRHYNILCWDRKSNKCKQFIPYPKHNLYYSLCKESRADFEMYFSKFYPSFADKHLLDYIKRSLVYQFQDYYFFRKSISDKAQNGFSAKIISPKYLKHIYEKRTPVFSFVLLGKFLLEFLLAFISIFKYLIICLMKRPATKAPDIIYLRNKEVPDALGTEQIKEIFKNSGLSFEGVNISFSKKIKKYGIYFINSFSASPKYALRSMFTTVKYAIYDLKALCCFCLPNRFYRNYIINTFKVISMLNLGPKVIFGVLEKNYSIMFNRYKKNGQITCTYSDGFLFYPSPGVDYVHADVFYSINEMDSLVVNQNGGEIGKIKEVGFIRSDIKAKSEGISEDLRALLNRYAFRVIVALTQVESEVYYPVTVEYCKKFMDSVYKIASKNSDCFFIVKEKKGELARLPREFIVKFKNLENCYIVPTTNETNVRKRSPWLNQYNHFEDLLGIGNLVISLAYNSTTIWQALSKSVCAISYLDGGDHSFLRKYKYFEVENNELELAFEYWKNVDASTFDNFIKEINLKTKMLEGGALRNMIEDICILAKNQNENQSQDSLNT